MSRWCVPFIVLAATLAGCRSNKEVISDKSLLTDSISSSASHRSMLVVDSLATQLDFSFDTLRVHIERPVAYAERPEVIRMTAVRGRVSDSRRTSRDSVEIFNARDTVAFHQSSADTKTEVKSTTRVMDPPSQSHSFLLISFAMCILVFLYLRKR